MSLLNTVDRVLFWLLWASYSNSEECQRFIMFNRQVSVCETPMRLIIMAPSFSSSPTVLKCTYNTHTTPWARWHLQQQQLMAFRDLTRSRNRALLKVLCRNFRGITSLSRHHTFLLVLHANQEVNDFVYTENKTDCGSWKT